MRNFLNLTLLMLNLGQIMLNLGQKSGELRRKNVNFSDFSQSVYKLYKRVPVQISKFLINLDRQRFIAEY